MTLIKREDAIEAVHKYFMDKINNEPHEIDEDGDDVFTDMKSVNALFHHNKMVSKAIKALPSADAPPYCVLGPRPPFRKPKTWHEKNSHTYICGDCGFEQAIYGNINEYNCCPRCGIYKEYVDFGCIFPQKRTPYREDGET